VAIDEKFRRHSSISYTATQLPNVMYTQGGCFGCILYHPHEYLDATGMECHKFTLLAAVAELEAMGKLSSVHPDHQLALIVSRNEVLWKNIIRFIRSVVKRDRKMHPRVFGFFLYFARRIMVVGCHNKIVRFVRPRHLNLRALIEFVMRQYDDDINLEVIYPLMAFVTSVIKLSKKQFELSIECEKLTEFILLFTKRFDDVTILPSQENIVPPCCHLFENFMYLQMVAAVRPMKSRRKLFSTFNEKEVCARSCSNQFFQHVFNRFRTFCQNNNDNSCVCFTCLDGSNPPCVDTKNALAIVWLQKKIFHVQKV